MENINTWAIADDIAKQIIADENTDWRNWQESVYSYVDSTEYVIYHYKAHQFLLNAPSDEVSNAEYMIECESIKSYDEYATQLAYWTLSQMVIDEICANADAYEFTASDVGETLRVFGDIETSHLHIEKLGVEIDAEKEGDLWSVDYHEGAMTKEAAIAAMVSYANETGADL